MEFNTKTIIVIVSCVGGAALLIVGGLAIGGFFSSNKKSNNNKTAEPLAGDKFDPKTCNDILNKLGEDSQINNPITNKPYEPEEILQLCAPAIVAKVKKAEAARQEFLSWENPEDVSRLQEVRTAYQELQDALSSAHAKVKDLYSFYLTYGSVDERLWRILDEADFVKGPKRVLRFMLMKKLNAPERETLNFLRYLDGSDIVKLPDYENVLLELTDSLIRHGIMSRDQITELIAQADCIKSHPEVGTAVEAGNFKEAEEALRRLTEPERIKQIQAHHKLIEAILSGDIKWNEDEFMKAGSYINRVFNDLDKAKEDKIRPNFQRIQLQHLLNQDNPDKSDLNVFIKNPSIKNFTFYKKNSPGTNWTFEEIQRLASS